MSYKLVYNSQEIIKISDGSLIPPEHPDYQDYARWVAEGNVPLPADRPTQQELDRQKELADAPLTAKQYFQSHQAAIDFIRLTPIEQETAIDGMTVTQLREVIKYLTIAVSALIKERYL